MKYTNKKDFIVRNFINSLRQIENGFNVQVFSFCKENKLVIKAFFTIIYTKEHLEHKAI